MFASLFMLAAATAAPATCSYNPKSGIKLGYAIAAPWFVNNREILVAKRRWVKFGLPRVLDAGELRRLATYRRAGVFVARDARKYEVIYVLLGASGSGIAPDGSDKVTGLACEYQPYVRKK